MKGLTTDRIAAWNRQVLRVEKAQAKLDSNLAPLLERRAEFDAQIDTFEQTRSDAIDAAKESEAARQQELAATQELAAKKTKAIKAAETRLKSAYAALADLEANIADVERQEKDTAKSLHQAQSMKIDSEGLEALEREIRIVRQAAEGRLNAHTKKLATYRSRFGVPTTVTGEIIPETDPAMEAVPAT